MSPGAGVTADPTLPVTRVLLVPVAAEHVPELRRVLATPEVWARWRDEAASPQWPFDDPSATRFAVLVEGAVRGMVQYGEEDEPDYRHASIDIFLDPAIHGRGVGRDTVATLARYLMHDRGHHRLVIDPGGRQRAGHPLLHGGGLPPGRNHAPLRARRQRSRMARRTAHGSPRRRARPVSLTTPLGRGPAAAGACLSRRSAMENDGTGQRTGASGRAGSRRRCHSPLRPAFDSCWNGTTASRQVGDLGQASSASGQVGPSATRQMSQPSSTQGHGTGQPVPITSAVASRPSSNMGSSVRRGAGRRPGRRLPAQRRAVGCGSRGGPNR